MRMLALYFSVTVFFLSSLSVFAQTFSRFHEHPSERAAFVEKLAKRAAEDRREAKAWAQARGLPMRTDDGRHLRELVAVRNGKPLYIKTHNSKAAISTAADKVRNTSPYNLNGTGVTVGVWDGGSVLTTHREFDSRVVDRDNVSSHYHATHVGGTIGASGVSPSAKGMASSASIDSYDWHDDLGEMTGAAASAPGLPGSLYLSNHSYGYGVGWEWTGSIWEFEGFDEFGQYNSESRQTDQIVYNAQYYLPFWSAGNDRGDTGSGSPVGDGAYKNGFDTISHNAIAKNVMTVGAVNDAVSPSGIRYLPGATMTTFSSWGPADDGRIKPDIVANGALLYSCDDASTSAYEWHSGTSMSSPNACGSAALLVDYYDKLFPGGAMRASTLKGLIIHTADDLDRPGPDYSYGWGLMNTLAAAELLADYAGGATIKLTEATVTTSHKSDTFSFQWNGIDPIRVTLCWTDPADSASSADDDRDPDLVNDLDLKVTGPRGTYYPYKLSYASPTANATATEENDVDNVEQVYIAAPTAGQYTITVDYDGSLTGGTQWYSLFVSGDSGDSDADGMPDSWEALYFGGVTNAVATADLDGDGSDNYTEYIAGTLPNDPGSVFKVTSFAAGASGGSPFILDWSTMPGRIYSVDYTSNLKYIDFATLPGATDLPYTRTSYTDVVERAGSTHFYRVDVQLDQ